MSQAPWVKLSRKLAAETLKHWRAWVLSDEEDKRERARAQPTEWIHARSAYQIPRDTRALCRDNVKRIAFARATPTKKQLMEDLGDGFWLKLPWLRDWPKRHLVLALEDFARRFAGTDFAPAFARRVLMTLERNR